MQPAMASGAVTMIAGVRNGRYRPGSVRRSTMTAIETAAKANSVPELETSASRPTGKNAAKSATNTPVRTVMTCGVWKFGCTFAKNSGSEEHTSELQSLMRISYAVFSLKKKKTKKAC